MDPMDIEETSSSTTTAISSSSWSSSTPSFFSTYSAWPPVPAPAPTPAPAMLQVNRSSVTIYVLECAHSKYYVGKTRSALPHTRVLDHFRGHGSEWTLRHPPVRVVATFFNCSDFDEDKHTKQYMAMYGIENVRGGAYCRVELPEETVRFLEREIRGAQDACLRCGRTSHFVADCFARTDVRGNPIIDQTPAISPNSSRGGGNQGRSIQTYAAVAGASQVQESTRDTCFRCGRQGHWARNCPARTSINGNRS